MSRNKKVLNATLCSENGLNFKSKLEKMVYDTLISLGFNPEYESKTFILWKGFKSVTPFYDRESLSQRNRRLKKGILPTTRILSLQSPTLRDITYTPDFYLSYNDMDIFIETKGFTNDIFPIKKKMFRAYLDNILIETGRKSLFFEVYTKQNLLQAVEIIKNF